jgi:hypothetical protein
MCYKIHHQLIAIEPANYYTAGGSRTRGNHRLRQINAKKDTVLAVHFLSILVKEKDDPRKFIYS